MCRKSITLTISIVVLILCMGPLMSSTQGELIGHWKFDETEGTIATDSAGGDNDGTFFGVQLEWATGRSGGALWLGGDDYSGVEFPTTGLSATTGTVAMWGVLVDPQPAHTKYFFGHTTQPQWTNRIQLYTDSGNNLLDLGLGDSHTRQTDIVELPMNEWSHVALTWNSGIYVVYVDGVEVATGSYTGLTDVNDIANIGNDGSRAPYEGFAGLLDDVRLYNDVLNTAEIQAVIDSLPLENAWLPNPRNGSLLLSTWANLEWKAGDSAVSHDLYIGDNFNDVNDATHDSPVFYGNLTAISSLAGFPSYPIPGGFVAGTTYYWRIDEVDDTNPDSPWKGEVWSFSIPPNTAYSPNPADGAGYVDPNTALSWTAGIGALMHTVYTGDNFDDVNNATNGEISGTTTYKPANAFEMEKVIYWRVDEFDGSETRKGDIWAFTTPGAVGNPEPANGAVDVQMNTVLTWAAADNATSHELYFGTDADAVKNATTASPEYVGPRALGAVSYDPGGLEWESDYAWRVDEVYPTGTVKGLVWTFTTADFILVDDFEAYNDIDQPDPASNTIFGSWIDGYLNPTTNGAITAEEFPPYAEQKIVHSGSQSMKYIYDTNFKICESTRTLDYPRDWTEGGVTKLVLWFKGTNVNDAERMFIALNGTAVVYHDDPAAAQKSGWTKWEIDLQKFADQGVNLTNVNTITIGFGTKGSPAAGGTGTVYFDDIRLYR